jgi:hypothetical protein
LRQGNVSAMMRGPCAALPIDDLGELLERPLAATLGVYRRDGTMLLTPVWHRWRGGRFTFQIAMLERDPRISLLIAENEFPYRAIEVTGTARLSRDRYAEIGAEINDRYIQAYDPDSTAAAYLGEGGVVVEVDARTMRSWDYADDGFV